MEINFKGQLLNKTFVNKYNYRFKTTLPNEVSFVELKKDCKNDLKVLRKVAGKWGCMTFANRIYKNFKNKDDLRTFALTTQDYNYEKLSADKILGLSQMTIEQPGVYNLDFLQTHPKYTAKNNPDRDYQNIGTGILNSLKKIFNNSTITVTTLPSAIDFYLKNGFDFSSNFLFDLFWKKDNTDL